MTITTGTTPRVLAAARGMESGGYVPPAHGGIWAHATATTQDGVTVSTSLDGASLAATVRFGSVTVHLLTGSRMEPQDLALVTRLVAATLSAYRVTHRDEVREVATSLLAGEGRWANRASMVFDAEEAVRTARGA